MKYFMAIDMNAKRHIIVAHNLAETRTVAEGSVEIDCINELLPDTFDRPGFLISDK